MSAAIGLLAYKLAYQLSPIVLTGGIATSIPGQMLPVVALTQPLQLVDGLLSGAADVELDDFFANFHPMPGATLIDNKIATFPFANQNVAGNAIIGQPLALSMLMVCPARDFAGYPLKLVTMMALKAVLDRHSARGGTYTIMTPSYLYTNGILTGLRDASSGESKQAQNAWQWDFQFPLLTLNQAQSAQNSLMARFTGQTQIQGQPAWSGVSTMVSNPSNLASSSVLPISANTPGTQVAGVS